MKSILAAVLAVCILFSPVCAVGETIYYPIGAGGNSTGGNTINYYNYTIISDSTWNTSYLLSLTGSSWILSNKSEILFAESINNTAAQAAALRAADDHIATNASAGGVSAPAALQAADAHILTNMTLGAGANWTTLIQSDFFDPSTQAIPGFLGAAVSSGTVGAVASDANHPGVIYMRDSTTAAGGYRYGCAGTQVLQGGEFYEVVFQPVGVRSTQGAKFGWADTR